MLQLYIPKSPEVEVSLVAVASGEEKRISYREHEGPPGAAQEAVERVLDGKSTLAAEFRAITEPVAQPEPTTTNPLTQVATGTGVQTQYPQPGRESLGERGQTGETKPTPLQPDAKPAEPTQIITGKKNDDGSNEMRMDSVVRTQPKLGGIRGDVDIRKSKAKAKDMINKGPASALHLPSRSSGSAPLVRNGRNAPPCRWLCSAAWKSTAMPFV